MRIFARFSKRVLAMILSFTMIMSVLTDIISFAAQSMPSPVAEEFDNSNSSRVYLNWMNGTFGGVKKKNFIHVYAFEGDTICLGSDVYNAGGFNLEGNKVTSGEYFDHNDKDSIDIVMYDLDNKPTALDVTKNGKGHISDYETEQLAKSMTSPTGNTKNGKTYTPITYTVRETGVYTFEFRSYSGGGSTGTVKKQDGWLDPSDSSRSGLIAAWDVSVFNEDGDKEHGRTYSDYMSLQMNGGDMMEKYYILTTDSYIYEMTFNGATPFTYNFFSNNRGIIDSATGNIVYKSVKDTSNTNSFTKLGISYKYPGTKDTDLSKSFYIFFEKPNDDLEGHLYEKALEPDPAKNIHFVDKIKTEDGEEVPGSYVGRGGYFAFDVEDATTATLRLEFKSKIAGETYAPVEISDVVKPHSTNYFYWDGKDGKGKVIPAGDYSIENLVYTVTTKAGEIHFPIFDMENASKGITFTRVSNIYNKNGDQLDKPGTVYDATRSVVYYDDTAIYYGENVASTGVSENQVDVAKDKFNTSDGLDPAGKYFQYNNMLSTYNGSEYKAFNSDYRKKHKLRVGDHSHTSNIIDFTASTVTDEQQAMIDFLDSKKNPVGISSSTAKNGTVTDYAIINFWTFIPSEPVSASGEIDDEIKIVDVGEKGLFNLTGRVFYDANSNGTYNAMDDADSILSGVKLRLYKKTEDTLDVDGKTYVDENCNPLKPTQADGKDVYELVKEDTTPLIGSYFFSNLEYDKENGTQYLYQVVKPNPNYKLTSKLIKGNTSAATGIYSLYAFDANSYGTEIQKFKVGGEGGVDPTKAKNDRYTVTAIDVGYYYDLTAYALTVKKDWQIPSGTDIKQPDTVAYEISYNIDEGDGRYKVGTYEMRSLSGIGSWNHTYDYLETNIEGDPVIDYYVSAEYYIYKDKIFRHKFDYKADDRNGTYQDFVGDEKYFSLTDYYKEHRDLVNPGNENGGYTIANMPDFDGNGASNANDFKAIEESQWKTALAAGSTPIAENSVVAPFNSVLDRNPGTATTEINITNSTMPGTIEVYKYTDDDSGARIPLDGATFRVYKGNMEKIKELVSNYNDAQAKLSANPDSNDLKQTFQKAAEAIQAVQVDSGSTRINGMVAFPGLDPQETYTVRERYAPDGYRILEEYYQVNPKGSSTGDLKFNNESYCLVQIGNAAAEGELEIRKRIESHEWESGYSFDFDINFNYDGDTLTNDITINDDANLFDGVEGNNWKSVVMPFVKKLNDNEKDVTINYDNDYITLTDGSTSPDTKSSENLLTAGSESEKAALNGVSFPAAGSYTFTVKENDLPKDSTLTKSPRVYTVTINAVRVLNDSAKSGEGKVDPPFTKDNSHLEAEVSKITVYEVDGEGNSGVTTTYAASAPVFTNAYVVSNVTQHTAYSVVKNFTGRDWTDEDEFIFLIESVDEQTRNALENNNLKLDATGLNKTEVTGQYSFTIKKNTSDHKFTFDNIEFDNIIFPVEDSDDDGIPERQPVVYTLRVKEQIPGGIEDGRLKGIAYSDVEYTLKITLENTEDDNIIDVITFELSNNKQPSTVYKCEIKQEVVNEHTPGAVKEGDVWVLKTENHNSQGHLMTFANNYRAVAAWTPKVSKTLLGRKFADGESFSFTLTETDRRSDKIFTGSRRVSISSNNAQANFPQISFTKAGEYEFTLTEENPTGESITTETVSYIIKVHAVDNGDGTLTLNFDPVSGYDDFDTNTVVNFVNTFTDSGNFDFSITKTLTGRAWTETDNFTFNIKPDDITKAAIKAATDEPEEIKPQIIVPSQWGKPDENGVYTITVSKIDAKGTDINNGIIAKALGEVQVKNVQSTDNRTFKFTVSEINIPKGIKCVENSIDLTVTVTPKTSTETDLPTGELEIVTTYAYAEKVGTPESLSFINNYSANGSLTDDLSITKILNGRKDNKWLDTDSFTFNIEGNDEITRRAIESKKISLPEEIVISSAEDSTVKINNNIRFSDITFPVEDGITQDLVYQFKIFEEKGGIDGINYDNSKYIVTVKLSDKSDGTFNSSITGITKDGESVEVGGNLTFTNEYIPAVLQVSKTVVNADGTDPGDTQFEFKVTLKPSMGISLEKSYPYVIHATGNADAVDKSGDLELTEDTNTFTFKLKHGQTIEIKYLPDKTSYSVTETQVPGYSTVKEGDIGTLEIKKTSKASFTNTLLNKHNLTISKTVSGESGDKKKDWNFDIALTSPEGVILADRYECTGISDELTLTKSESTYKASISLKHSQSITINDLPDGTVYKITESEANKAGYKTTIFPFDATPNDGVAEGTITANTSVGFDNRNPIGTGNLYITKDVKGESGDTNKEFTFTVSLKDSLGNPVKQGFKYSGSKEGTIYNGGEIKLKNGEKVVISYLPLGTQYEVNEVEANRDGYVTTSKGASGVFDNINEDKTAIFTNSRGTGTLTISKLLDESGSTPPNMERLFNFRITLDLTDDITDETVDYSYTDNSELPKIGRLTFKKEAETGYYTADTKLKIGQSITIKNLIDGTKYSVIETDIPVGYTPNVKYTPEESANWGGPISSESDEFKVDIVNKYKVTSAEYIPQVNKTVTGNPPNNVKFTFNIEEGAGNPENGAVLSSNTATVMGSGSTNFGAITFTKAGTYTFKITEKDGGEHGYTYDGSEWTLTVEVEDNESQLEVVNYSYTKIGAIENKTRAEFTNIYKTNSTTYSPSVLKKIDGYPSKDEVFTFRIVESDSNSGATLPENKTVTVTGAGNTNFGAITFTKSGTYTFKIKESDGGVHGYIYDDSEWTLTVEVVDNDSQLEVLSHTYTKDGASSNDCATFTNRYEAASVDYIPKVTKTLIGQTPPSEGTFNFSIKEKADNPSGAVLPEDTTAAVKGSGTARFGAITFTKSGEYKFEIRETKGEEAGYTYDESVWTLTVVVVDNDSHLEVEGHSYTKAGGITNDNGAEFTNKYNVTPAKYTPKVTKTISGIVPANNKRFTFEISANLNNPSGVTMPDNTTAEVTGAGSTSFNAITFSKAGTYNFEIKETKGEEAGYTYDESVWTMTVVVTDEESQLKVSSTAYSKIGAQSTTEATFTNIYNVKSTEYEPRVKKTVTGNPSSDKTFTFGITAKADNPNGATPPANAEAKVVGSGTASFGKIIFTKAGTYVYEIKETQGNEPGYSYDGSVWTLTVEVIDDNSQLKVNSAEYSKTGAESTENAEFENSYSTTEVSYAPQVEKEITGEVNPSDKTFTFNIEASADNPEGAEMLEDTTATVKGAGSASFKDITFTKAGTYTFKISEAKESEAGYTYDESVWTLKVVVEDVDSVLTVKSHTYEKEVGTSSEERALFTNTYSVEPTEYAPQVEKTVTGNTPSDEDFTFKIKASADNPDGAEMPEDTTATVTGEGTTSFGNITFTKAGTYTFEISEEKGNEAGYTYDESVWTLTVVVVDNESKLEVQSHTYTKTDGTANEGKAEFKNIYNPIEPKTDPTTEPTSPTNPTDPTTPTSSTNSTNPTNPTESTTKKPAKTTKKTTTTKKKKSKNKDSSEKTNTNPPYSKTKNPTSNNNSNTSGGNNGNTPNTGSEGQRNLPIAFLVTFLLGLNTVYLSFKKRRLKGRKVK